MTQSNVSNNLVSYLDMSQIHNCIHLPFEIDTSTTQGTFPITINVPIYMSTLHQFII